MAFLNPEEISRFLTSAENDPFPYYYLFRTKLYAGLRRSKILGLIWRNVDLDLCTLSVTQTLHRFSGKYIIQPPKTKSGCRVINLPPSLTLVLREYRVQVETQRLILRKTLTDSDLVFAHIEDGTPLNPPTVTHTFIKTSCRTGLKVRLHDLRHTYASITFATGVNIKAISQALGHANVSITLSVYSHLIRGTGKSAAAKFDRLLEPWLEKNVAKPY